MTETMTMTGKTRYMPPPSDSNVSFIVENKMLSNHQIAQSKKTELFKKRMFHPSFHKTKLIVGIIYLLQKTRT